jgi:hypothetical protein
MKERQYRENGEEGKSRRSDRAALQEPVVASYMTDKERDSFYVK